MENLKKLEHRANCILNIKKISHALGLRESTNIDELMEVIKKLIFR